MLKVLEQVESVAYKLKLPQELSRVHNTFHVSNLKKCYSDDPLVVPLEGLQVDNKLHFVEEPVEIMDREVKQLRRSRVPIVKVRWNSRRGPEFTWEREDQFRKKYPHLFTKTAPSSRDQYAVSINWNTPYRDPCKKYLNTGQSVEIVGPTNSRGSDLYGFADTLEAAPGRRMSRELGYEEDGSYILSDDARYDRALLRARVNMLDGDRPFHRRTAILMEEEARLSRAAWAQSMDACDQVHSEGILLRTTVIAQQSEIVELQAADRRRQTVISELLKADYRRQRQLVEALKIVKSLKTQMIELQTQQGPAKDPAEPELPEEASSSS
ncbi:hypothetical protein Tco_1101771 [Tanacetum coccineum]